MGDNSKIEWTDATWNCVTGCTKVSPGCDHCYAERVTERFHGPGSFARVQLHEDRLSLPLRWRKPRRVFVNSMSDVFHEAVPDEFIARMFAVMAASPQHTFQVLTKRHGRMRSLLSSEAHGERVAAELASLWGVSRVAPFRGPLPNVWLGVSVEDQKWANIRIPALLDTPAAVRFLSCEPLLGPVNLWQWINPSDPCVDCDVCGEERFPDEIGRGHDRIVDDGERETWCPGPSPGADPRRIAWVIAGGESGAAARPLHPDWARQIRDHCQHADVPFFFKQWGEYLPVPVFDANMNGGRAWEFPPGTQTAAILRERSPGAFRTGQTRLMRPGESNGYGTLLDADTMALRLGKHKTGRELDGREWNEYPHPQERIPAA